MIHNNEYSTFFSNRNHIIYHNQNLKVHPFTLEINLFHKERIAIESINITIFVTITFTIKRKEKGLCQKSLHYFFAFNHRDVGSTRWWDIRLVIICGAKSHCQPKYHNALNQYLIKIQFLLPPLLIVSHVGVFSVELKRPHHT